MTRNLLFILAFSFSQCLGQSSDVLLLKKHDQTFRRYFAGSDIELTTNTGAYVNGHIYKISNDSLFIKVFVVQQMPTNLGVYVLDTVTTYYYKYHYNQIKTIGAASKGFDMSASAASLLGGGSLIVVGSGVVYLADRKKFSPPLLIAGGVLAGVGYLMAKTSGRGMPIGKKYSLVYLAIGDNKKPGT